MSDRVLIDGEIEYHGEPPDRYMIRIHIGIGTLICLAFIFGTAIGHVMSA